MSYSGRPRRMASSMGYVRDLDAYTRGAGAVASMDGYSRRKRAMGDVAAYVATRADRAKAMMALGASKPGAPVRGGTYSAPVQAIKTPVSKSTPGGGGMKVVSTGPIVIPGSSRSSSGKFVAAPTAKPGQPTIFNPNAGKNGGVRASGTAVISPSGGCELVPGHWESPKAGSGSSAPIWIPPFYRGLNCGPDGIPLDPGAGASSGGGSSAGGGGGGGGGSTSSGGGGGGGAAYPEFDEQDGEEDVAAPAAQAAEATKSKWWMYAAGIGLGLLLLNRKDD